MPIKNFLSNRKVYLFPMEKRQQIYVNNSGVNKLIKKLLNKQLE